MSKKEPAKKKTSPKRGLKDMMQEAEVGRSSAPVSRLVAAEIAEGKVKGKSQLDYRREIGVRICTFANSGCLCAEKNYPNLCQGVEREALKLMELARDAVFLHTSSGKGRL